MSPQMARLVKRERRDDDIRALRKSNPKKWTLEKLGKRYSLTKARVQQIVVVA